MTSLPLRYYTSARSDFQSSQIVIGFTIKHGDSFRYKSVAFLAGFAIELYLKAWLSADGVDELLKTALDRGYSPTSSKFKELVDALGKLHRKFETRYLKEDTEIPVLTLDGYSAEMEKIDADVIRYVHYVL